MCSSYFPVSCLGCALHFLAPKKSSLIGWEKKQTPPPAFLGFAAGGENQFLGSHDRGKRVVMFGAKSGKRIERRALLLLSFPLHRVCNIMSGINHGLIEIISGSERRRGSSEKQPSFNQPHKSLDESLSFSREHFSRSLVSKVEEEEEEEDAYLKEGEKSGNGNFSRRL